MAASSVKYQVELSPDPSAPARGPFARLRSAFLNTQDFWLIVSLSLIVFLGVRGYSLRTMEHPAAILFDASWNKTIIERGYFTDGNREVEHNVAFSPLYPLVCRLFIAAGMEAEQAMFTVSTLSSVLGLYVIYVLIRRHYPRHIARSTLALLALNPFAVFFYNGYSESLFLLLIALFFYFLEVRQINWAAALCVGLASATRPYGCLLAIIFVFELLRRQYEACGVRKVSVHWRELLLLTPLCFSGLIAQTLYFEYAFQEPLAFSHSHFAWGSTPGQNVHWDKLLTFGNIGDSIDELNARPSAPFATGLILFLATPVLAALAWRKLKASLLLFAVMMFSFFQLTGHYGSYQMIATGRHMMVVFPVALMAALLLQGETVSRAATFLINREGITGEEAVGWRVFCAAPLYGVILLSLCLYALFVYRYFHRVFIA